MSRQLIVDTETTGLDPKNGHKIIEFAALEVIDRKLTGDYLHLYINPEREIDAAATKVHGMTHKDLVDKPNFATVANQIVEYINGAELIIHNAKFDVGFLNHQLKVTGLNEIKDYTHNVIDTLMLARQKYAGSKNTLDALCDRFKINRQSRDYHGAVIDCHLLFEVYLALTKEQISLIDDDAMNAGSSDHKLDVVNFNNLNLLEITVNDEELALHHQILSNINSI